MATQSATGWPTGSGRWRWAFQACRHSIAAPVDTRREGGRRIGGSVPSELPMPAFATGRAPRLLTLACLAGLALAGCQPGRSEEHTSELQSLMRISYAVFCLK